MAGAEVDTLRIQPWAQLANLLAAVLVFIAGLLMGLPLLTAQVLISLVVLVGATAAMFWISRNLPAEPSGWVAVVPLVEFAQLDLALYPRPTGGTIARLALPPAGREWGEPGAAA